ncbi:MAG TPA: aminotransferase class V-fold PLP-dependent enzyme [Beijerinckiaceae bacterium]|nr:aminotransferase class V-fold PLP-dependent enzyme [Beijerinckiaceae bacterium]
MKPLDLTAHFSRFLAVPGRIHLAAHSHHFWPDVTREAQLLAWDDACRHADEKWEPLFAEVIPAVQRAIAAVLGLPAPQSIAFAPNTHDFVRRLLSTLPERPRILTTDGEFHSFARQVARLEEEGLIQVERVPHEPVTSFAERLRAAAARGGHHMVFVSHVIFNAGCTSGDIAALAAAVPDRGTLIVIDGYHGFMALPTDLSAVAGRVFYIAGGYKYAMGGENVCFMHCPPGYGERPRDTGWFAAFGALAGRQQGVPYGPDGNRFWGATFDPIGFYRLRAVFSWLEGLGLRVQDIHDHVLALQEHFLACVAARRIGALQVARLVTPMETRQRGHFLTFETPEAGALYERLLARRIVTDVRGDRIRFGFGLYHTALSVEQAADAISAAL